MADPSTTAASALKKWHHGVFIATLLLLISYPHQSRGQETAAVVGSGGHEDVVEEVADLEDVVDDAMADLTELVGELGSEEAVDGGGAGHAEDKSAEDDPASADAESADLDAETAVTPSNETEPRADGEAPTKEESDSSASGDSETPAPREEAPMVQSGPFIDLLGEVLLSLEMVDETHAQVHQHYTNEALSGKKVVGLYFSADWCGPCRQFTPDLVSFYGRMNARRGKQDQFEIVWISRCRTVDDFGQYFTQMSWLALPPNEAMGQRGQVLGERYKVKSIPTLVLLDEIGNVITADARNKIPMDKAGIGFPWRSPASIIVSTLVPKSFRLMVKNQLAGVLALVKRFLLGKGSQLKEAVANGGGSG